MLRVGVFVIVHFENEIGTKEKYMGCGLQDISEGHETHYCHKCENVYSLGSLDDNGPCKGCLNPGNCNFEKRKVV